MPEEPDTAGHRLEEATILVPVVFDSVHRPSTISGTGISQVNKSKGVMAIA